MCIMLSLVLRSQTDVQYYNEIEVYQAKQNEKFSNPETSLLTARDLERFDGLDFYPIDKNFRVEATFVRTPEEIPFPMPTTTSWSPEYIKYGEARFIFNNREYTLSLFQQTDQYLEGGDPGYLFVPFTDLTNGNGTYAGGRYLDSRIPDSTTIILDFNKAYNPYCVYNPLYACPIPPAENHLDIPVEAGIKDFKGN